MFVRQNQQQFRNSNADVQIFYGDGKASSASNFLRTWNKPPGVSHVYIMCIGSGGNGDGTLGGGSGAVTVWYGAAQNVPDSLVVSPDSGGAGGATRVGFLSGSSTSMIQLVVASSAVGTNSGTSTSAGTFAASGFYQSIAGQSGVSGNQSASTTTFLSGGSSGTVIANYGYGISVISESGYFLLQPIIVGVASGGSLTDRKSGLGCGGNANGSVGGQGMVLIASW
jgi:hypothetical protein